MALWYWEERHLAAWSPCTGPTRPETKGEYIRKAGAQGARIRGIAEIKNPKHHGFDLDTLQAIYGPKPELPAVASEAQA